MSHKWRWAEDHYDMFLLCCVSLTNLHIRKGSLRGNDGEVYQRCKNRLFEIGVNFSGKRRLTRKRYREKRKREMNIQFRGLDGDYTETESPNH